MITPIIIACAAVVLLMALSAAAWLLLSGGQHTPHASAHGPLHALLPAESIIRHEPSTIQERSIRDRELDEDAAAIAEEFRRVRRERYVAALRTDAAQYFGATSAKKSAS